MDFRTIEVYKECKNMHKFVENFKLPQLDPAAVEEGKRLSKTVCKAPETVFTTPLGKNLLVYFGDVEQHYDNETGEWSTDKLEVGKKSKAIDWVNDFVHAALRKYNGPEKHEYDTSLGVFDPDHYNVDCWNGFKPEVWDIQPGQTETVKRTAKGYRNPTTNYGFVNLIRDLENDENLGMAVKLWFAMYPEFCASKEVHDVSDPFKHKGTGTSYPDYHNDGTVVKGMSITYGQLCVNDVIAAYEKGQDYFFKYLTGFLAYTLYIRRQRGKGRALEAMARRFNIAINMINAPEMEALKETTYGTGLKNEQGVKEDLIRVGELVEQLGPEYGAYNLDATQWDFNLGDGLVLLQDACRKVKTNGDFSKKLVDYRYLGNHKAYLIDGLNDSCLPIYGRMMSGYDDTTLGNTNANRITSIAGALSVDPNWTAKVYYPLKGAGVITLGDDLLVVIPRDKKSDFCKYIASKGIKLHNDEKDAFGIFFVQYRVIKVEGKYLMGYNWPRVLRSLLSKEDQKSLGPAGWTLSFYQQIAKCREFKDSLRILVNFAAALDKDKLSLDRPVKDLIAEVNQEDQNKMANTSKSRRALTTAEVLSGGNPQALGMTEDGKLDTNFFEEIQAEMRAVYDPNFMQDLGFGKIDLSKVH